MPNCVFGHEKEVDSTLHWPTFVYIARCVDLRLYILHAALTYVCIYSDGFSFPIGLRIITYCNETVTTSALRLPSFSLVMTSQLTSVIFPMRSLTRKFTPTSALPGAKLQSCKFRLMLFYMDKIIQQGTRSTREYMAVGQIPRTKVQSERVLSVENFLI